MARRKRIKIYWLQFVLAAVWVGVIEVVLGNTIHPEIRRTLVDILVVLTGVLAFEPLGRHIFKYALVAFIASILIQILRKLGRWYMSAGPGFWEIGGPIIALAAITALVFLIGYLTNKDHVRF